MSTFTFYSYSLLGNNIHFIHRDRNRLDHKPINSVLQLVGVQHVDFTSRPSVIHVWHYRLCRFLMDLGIWPELWECSILVQCLTCWLFPAFEELWNHKETTSWIACWEASVVKNVTYIYNFIAFKVLFSIKIFVKKVKFYFCKIEL